MLLNLFPFFFVLSLIIYLGPGLLQYLIFCFEISEKLITISVQKYDFTFVEFVSFMEFPFHIQTFCYLKSRKTSKQSEIVSTFLWEIWVEPQKFESRNRFRLSRIILASQSCVQIHYVWWTRRKKIDPKRIIIQSMSTI